MEFPSVDQFNTIVGEYLQNLSLRKRDKALVDSHRYSLILKVLKDPRNTAISTAQFRFWVKKMFRLSKNNLVYHDNKPVATREDIYSIIILAHKEAHHGGRDKTSALVCKRYSWIPKELVARFVRHCPFCISRRNPAANKKCCAPSSITMAANVATLAAASTISSTWTDENNSYQYYYNYYSNHTPQVSSNNYPYSSSSDIIPQFISLSSIQQTIPTFI